MGVLEDMADELARDTIEAAEALNDPQLIDDVAKAMGARSQTAEQAFMTAVRVRLAAATGRRFLEERIAKARAAAAKSAGTG